MIIHPQIIEKEGKNEFVIIPYEEFLLIQKALEDLDDLKELREEKECYRKEPARKLDEVIKDLNL